MKSTEPRFSTKKNEKYGTYQSGKVCGAKQITPWFTVRCHINWNNQRPDLKGDPAHLVQDIKPRIFGIANALAEWRQLAA
jgi:hypothetical protein